MSRGVWPEQHGQGLGLFMRQWAEEQVARDGGNSLTIWVHFSNKTHWNNVITDPYWTVAGSAIDPAAMMFVHEIDNAQT